MTAPQPAAPIRPIRLILRLTGLGLLGVLALLPSIPALLKDLPAGAPPMPVMLAISVLQTMLLVAATAALGTWLAPKLGFEAPVLTGQRPLSALREMVRLPLLAGVATGIVLVAGDLLFQPYLPASLSLLAQKPAIGELVPALLYGGIDEEILLRWGVMSLLTWLLYRIFSGGKGPVRSAVLWTGIVGATLLFGAGHLPAVKAIAGAITLPLLIRTLLLNGVGGVVFGWFFARRGLESAMVAHMGAHLGMFLMRVLLAG